MESQRIRYNFNGFDNLNLLNGLRESITFYRPKNIFGKKIDCQMQVLEDEHGLLFSSEKSPHLDFYVHDLEIKTPAEVIALHSLAKYKQTARLSGIYIPNIIFNRGKGEFQGLLRTDEQEYGLITRNNHIERLVPRENMLIHQLLLNFLEKELNH